MKQIKMWLYFFIVFLFSSASFAQEKSTSFVGRDFIQKEGIWYIKDNGRKFKLVQNQVIVKLKNNKLITDLNWEKYQLPKLEKVERVNITDYLVLKIPDNFDIMNICEKLLKTEYFESIEPDSYAEYHDIPNDNLYVNQGQWNLDKINMQDAWEVSTGSSNIVVAIIDAGGAYNHEDLIGNKNTAYLGYNFDDGIMNNDPYNPIPYDYHGTACAGLISASTNNNTGVASIGGGWNSAGVKLMYFQCAKYNYGGNYRAPIQVSWVAYAIEMAADSGANVISISLGFATNSAVTSAITNADLQDIVVVASSGNYSKYWRNKPPGWVYEESSVQFPGTHPKVITVGATIENDRRKKWDDGTDEPTWGSCFGTALDIVAPGIHIPTTNWTGVGNANSIT